MGTTHEKVLEYLNLVFTGLFSIEMIMKTFGLGFFEYVADKMNIFDCFIVSTSILDLIMSVSFHNWHHIHSPLKSLILDNEV